jgi:phage terminase Nu1 subunit (DNA packaging protein)
VLSDIRDKEKEESEEENESDLEDMASTPKRRKLAREKALNVSLQSGLNPTF